MWERGGLKDFLCGVVMLDEMMDEVMMMGEVMVGEVVVVEVMMGNGELLKISKNRHQGKTTMRRV